MGRLKFSFSVWKVMLPKLNWHVFYPISLVISTQTDCTRVLQSNIASEHELKSHRRSSGALPTPRGWADWEKFLSTSSITLSLLLLSSELFSLADILGLQKTRRGKTMNKQHNEFPHNLALPTDQTFTKQPGKSRKVHLVYLRKPASPK